MKIRGILRRLAGVVLVTLCIVFIPYYIGTMLPITPTSVYSIDIPFLRWAAGTCTLLVIIAIIMILYMIVDYIING